MMKKWNKIVLCFFKELQKDSSFHMWQKKTREIELFKSSHGVSSYRKAFAKVSFVTDIIK